jgi:hypothetical protein
MKTFRVQHDCGCCYSDVKFENRKNADYAIAKVGLGNAMTLVDDTGQVIERVDTFYGIMEENESSDNPLGRLFNQVFGKG